MISLNMSPETKVGKIEDKNNNELVIRHVNGQVFNISNEKFLEFCKKEEIAISKANVLFTQKRKGVMPEILDYYYGKRVEIKKELGKYKREYSKNHT